MGRGRAPCCAKVGLNKGSWTAEEDMRLIAYVQKHGHGNWRALPKSAGLLRCGKSCRLRWINYLRPDIKRGNFTKEEEETIIKLHKLLGNKWSKIASFLPGRTDNEIKNVWNTHLKKRLASDDKKPATGRDTNNPDEEPSSPASSTTFQGRNKSEREHDSSVNRSLDSGNSVIEIPEEPNMDMWSMLEDDDLSGTLLQPYNSSNIASSSSSTDLLDLDDTDHEKTRPPEYITNQEEANKDQLVVVPDVLIDPADIWRMIEDDDDACSIPLAVDITRSSSSLTLQEESSTGQGSSSVEWLDYLEEELGLREAAVAMEDQEILTRPSVEMEGDPVTCYFQKGASTPTH